MLGRLRRSRVTVGHLRKKKKNTAQKEAINVNSRNMLCPVCVLWSRGQSTSDNWCWSSREDGGILNATCPHACLKLMSLLFFHPDLAKFSFKYRFTFFTREFSF